MKAHVLRFPRIGENRELKKALKQFWKEAVSENECIQQTEANSSGGISL